MKGRRVHVRDYLLILRRRWPLVSSLALLGLIVGVVVSLLTPTVYSATASLLVSVTPDSGTVDDSIAASNQAKSKAAEYAATAEAPEVIDRVADLTSIDDRAALASAITVTVADGLPVLVIAATGADPETVVAVANAMADSLADAVLERSIPAEGKTPIALERVDESSAVKVVAPQVPRNIGLGLIVGALIGFLLAVVLHLNPRQKARPSGQGLDPTA